MLWRQFINELSELQTDASVAAQSPRYVGDDSLAWLYEARMLKIERCVVALESDRVRPTPRQRTALELGRFVLCAFKAEWRFERGRGGSWARFLQAIAPAFSEKWGFGANNLGALVEDDLDAQVPEPATANALSPEARLLAVLVKHPGWNVTEIARGQCEPSICIPISSIPRGSPAQQVPGESSRRNEKRGGGHGGVVSWLP